MRGKHTRKEWQAWAERVAENLFTLPDNIEEMKQLLLGMPGVPKE
jgi:hypothetical protein